MRVPPSQLGRSQAVIVDRFVGHHLPRLSGFWHADEFGRLCRRTGLANGHQSMRAPQSCDEIRDPCHASYSAPPRRESTARLKRGQIGAGAVRLAQMTTKSPRPNISKQGQILSDEARAGQLASRARRTGGPAPRPGWLRVTARSSLRKQSVLRRLCPPEWLHGNVDPLALRFPREPDGRFLAPCVVLNCRSPRRETFPTKC